MSCQSATVSTTALGLVERVEPHRCLTVELRDAERHHRHRLELGKAIEDAGHRVVEDRAVVHARADDDLALHDDVVIEQGAKPAEAHRAARVLQHVAADVGVGGMDADVQRRQPLGHDPFQVGLGEPGEGREVPVQERQPVVVVLEVQRSPHSLRQLVDEAELAVVVARADPVEHRARDLDPERRALRLVDRHRQLEAAT